MDDKIIRCGPQGSGISMKIVNNFLAIAPDPEKWGWPRERAVRVNFRDISGFWVQAILSESLT